MARTERKKDTVKSLDVSVDVTLQRWADRRRRIPAGWSRVGRSREGPRERRGKPRDAGVARGGVAVSYTYTTVSDTWILLQRVQATEGDISSRPQHSSHPCRHLLTPTAFAEAPAARHVRVTDADDGCGSAAPAR